ncbi:MAG: carboxypeptidase-like regulatory domain-containing protein, partial [Chitinophagaceae bacterium]
MKYFLIFALAVIGLSANAQSCKFQLTGTVIDVDTRLPLQGVNLLLREQNKYFTTNESGFYRIEGLCAGNYTLLLTHADCLPIEYKVKLDSSMQRNFAMPHTYNQLQEIV